jgi:hypothetical protein
MRASRFCSAVLLLTSVSLSSAAPAWHLLGLSGRQINCILADDTTMILAGTELGLSVYWNNSWFDFSLARSVLSIARLAKGMIAIGAASDSVYFGKVMIYGPPFYVLKRQHSFAAPTAMVMRPPMAIDRICVGGPAGVSVYMLGNDTLIFERKIPAPPYAFGVEMPRCADLLWWSGSEFYAGGYDRSPDPGPGSLLSLVGDSLRILKRWNVTALGKGNFSETGPQELAVATTDTGVLVLNPATSGVRSLGGPDAGAVNDLLLIPNMLRSYTIIAASGSGVFTNSGNGKTWTELGNIPAAPLCLASRGTPSGRLRGEIVAGTRKGVYLYTDIPARAVDRQAKEEGGVRPVVRARNGQAVFDVGSDVGRFTLLSASGKAVGRADVCSGRATIALPSAGVFIGVCSRNCAAIGSIVIVNVP